jgi:enamine deaminase RidA (YjgF/YER057c/UK114 family)
MGKRQNIFDGTELAPGYCRAVRVGAHVHVSGTMATDADGNVMGDDAHSQSLAIYRKIAAALQEAGADLSDVVRVVCYATDIDEVGEWSAAHAEVFKDINPACTHVEVSRLARPEIKVEIEAYAIIAED